MARLKEPLNGGVVNISDAAVLLPGQLSDARNCHYLPGPGALQLARGRGSFGTVTGDGSDVVGIRDTPFNNTDQLIFALVTGGNLTWARMDTGTFALLTSVGGGTHLDSVQYNNRYYLFPNSAPTATAYATAVNTNAVIYLSATGAGQTPLSRPHGMRPVIAGPTATTAGGGTFPLTTTGYYEYWCTEVAKVQQDGGFQYIEGTFDSKSDPTTVQVSATSVVPSLTLPGARNSNTTAWRIYRAGPKTNFNDKLFPGGFQIAEVQTTGTSIAVADTIASGSISSASALTTTVNSGSNKYTDMGNSATACEAVGGTFGTMTTVGINHPVWQGFYGFTFAAIPGNIVGLMVEVKAWIAPGTAPVSIEAVVGPNRSASNGDWSYNNQKVVGGFVGNPAYHQGVSPVGKALSITATGNGQVAQFGASASPYDTWLPGNAPLWSPGDFDSNFMVVLALPASNAALNVDYVKLFIYYGGTSNTVIPFPQVVYTFGDTSAQVGKNGPPPYASMGDMFQDQLVVNDVNSPTTIRYSYPGDPDAFPSTYYVDFQTRENDVIRAIKNVNGRLMVWLNQSTWRINYLPSERDASFDRGKSREIVSGSYGCVNPMCVATFSMADQPEMAAWVSNQGIHITDGFGLNTITDGYDWSTIRTGSYKPIALINDKDRHQLLFYFFNSDNFGNETSLCLPMCYHKSHLVDGKPKIGGLIHMRNNSGANFGDLKSAWSAVSADGASKVYLGYGGSTAAGAGKMYIESTASAIPAANPSGAYITRRIYAASEGSEFRVNELYGYCPNYSGGAVVTYTPMTVKTNDTGETTRSARSVTLAGQRLHKVQFREAAEGLRISASISATGYSQEYLVFDGMDFGLEDSGR